MDTINRTKSYLNLAKNILKYPKVSPVSMSETNSAAHKDVTSDAKQFMANLESDVNPTDLVREYTLSLYKKSFTENLSLADLLINSIEGQKVVKNIPKNPNKILTDIADNRFKVKVNAVDEKALLSGIQKVTNRITSGLILSVLILGAVILMNIKTSFILTGYPGFAITLFSLATLGNSMLLCNIFVGDDR